MVSSVDSGWLSSRSWTGQSCSTELVVAVGGAREAREGPASAISAETWKTTCKMGKTNVQSFPGLAVERARGGDLRVSKVSLRCCIVEGIGETLFAVICDARDDVPDVAAALELGNCAFVQVNVNVNSVSGAQMQAKAHTSCKSSFTHPHYRPSVPL